jgi:hypothetical protein
VEIRAISQRLAHEVGNRYTRDLQLKTKIQGLFEQVIVPRTLQGQETGWNRMGE